MRIWPHKASLCHAQLAPSGKSCVSSDSSSIRLSARTSHWSHADRYREVQADFKDATTVPADPEGKQQHVVEVLNFVDAGTSILLSAQAHADFHAETALDAVVTFLRTYGLPPPPPMLTFDRDPRWVGSASGRDFPSSFRRFLRLAGHRAQYLPASAT
jgi:hypothetical protein